MVLRVALSGSFNVCEEIPFQVFSGYCIQFAVTFQKRLFVIINRVGFLSLAMQIRVFKKR